MDEQIKRRGPSKAMLDAEKYFASHQEISGTELARMFGVSRGTIHASEFWKSAKAKQSKAAS